MYAIISNGGRQYKVASGQKIRLAKMDNEPGSEIVLDKVMMVIDDQKQSTLVGKPFVEGALAHAKIVKHGRDKKIRIIKFKRRKHHMKRMGHRQDFTEVEITGINVAA